MRVQLTFQEDTGYIGHPARQVSVTLDGDPKFVEIMKEACRATIKALNDTARH